MGSMTPSASSAASFQALDLAELYRRERAFVRCSLLQCGVPSALVDDAVQDVFLVVHRRLADYDADRGSLRAWMFGISLRVARAHRRALGRTCSIPDTLLADAALADPERYVSQIKAAEAATRILETLPREQWSVLVMADVEGMTAPEIAHTLGVKVNTVYTRLMRARTKVRRQVQETGSHRWLASVWIGLGKFFRPTPLLASAAFVSIKTLRNLAAAAIVVAVVAAVITFSTDEPPRTDDPDVVASAAAGLPRGAARPRHGSSTALEGPSPAARTASIAGTVRGEGAAALPGAMVCAWRESEAIVGTGHVEPRCAKSKRDGHYRIERLLPGARYRVSASAPRHQPAQYVGDDGTPHVRLAPREHRAGVDIAARGGGVLVRGQVIDVIGGPIDNATVAVVDPSVGDGWSSQWGVVPPAMVRTDGEGAFSAWVGAGTVEVGAFASGYAPARISTSVPGPTVTIALAPESVLAGTVVDPDGEPVAGAVVAIAEFDDRGLGSAHTDEAGVFRLAGLPPGRYRVEATARGRAGRSASSRLLGIGETIDDVTIELRDAATVTARVVIDGTGEPCPLGGVAFSNDEHDVVVRTDEEGYARFDAVLPGTYRPMVVCEGFADGDYPALEVGTEPVQTEYTVVAGVSLRGRVVDDDGAALAGAWVSAYGTSAGATPAMRRAQSGDDGGFELSGLAPGSYNLGAVAPAGAEVSSLLANVGDDGLDGFAVEIPTGGVIEGTISTENGDPVADAIVRLPRHRHRRARTADDGTYRIEHVRPGEGIVVVQRDNDDHVPPTPVTVASGKTARVDVTLSDRNGTITGIVRDETGSPVADAVVVSGLEGAGDGRSTGAVLAGLRARSRWSRGRPPVLTDADGRFTLDDLPDGTHTVLAFRRGGGDAWKGGVALGSDVQLDLPHSTSLEGTVTTADDGSPGTMRVSVRGVDNGMELHEVFTGASGAFRFDDLDPGTYQVKVTAAAGRAMAETALAADRTGTLALQLSDAVRLEGTFIDLDTGAPVPNVLAISGPQDMDMTGFAKKAERSLMMKKNELRSDGQGRFVIPDADPGSLRIFALAAELLASDYALSRLVAEPKKGTTTLEPIALVRKRLAKDEPPGHLGFKLAPADSPFCTTTPTIGEVDAAPGLTAGDPITAINGHDVQNRRCYLADPLLQVPRGTKLQLTLSDDRTVEVTAK